MEKPANRVFYKILDMKWLVLLFVMLFPFGVYSKPPSKHDTTINAAGLRKGEVMRILGNDTLIIANPIATIPNVVEMGKDTFLLTDPVTGTTNIFIEFEEMPVAPYDFNKYLAKNLQYPDSLKTKGIEGRVNITFLVTNDGSISNVWILKSLHPALDNNALEIIRKMLIGNPLNDTTSPLNANSHFQLFLKQSKTA